MLQFVDLKRSSIAFASRCGTHRLDDPGLSSRDVAGRGDATEGRDARRPCSASPGRAGDAALTRLDAPHGRGILSAIPPGAPEDGDSVSTTASQVFVRTDRLDRLTRDILHEPYRARLIPAFDDLCGLARENGAAARLSL